MTDPQAAPTLSELGLDPRLTEAAQASGWRLATPIQAQAIPALLQGRDLLGVAPTGSGKTAAFLLPLLHRLQAWPGPRHERPRRLRALVLAPTRELAAQTAATALALAPQLTTVLAVGGPSINPQMMALRGGAHLVVATPGRLLDLLDHNALHLDDVAMLVLDEADRLLDSGFAEETARALARLPAQARRQTLMVSATMPEAVATLAASLLRDPLHVRVLPTAAAPAPEIVQRAIVVDGARRTPLLRQLIAASRWQRVLVFVATQYASEHVADKLRRAGIAAAALHGRLTGGKRQQALADFQAGRIDVLVATDLAARGLDIAGLAAVVNHDLPRSAVDYQHRIGRTGRAGRAGVAVSFVCADAPGSEAHFRLIEKRQQQRVPREQVEGFEPTAIAVSHADPRGGVKGPGKSKKDKLREAAAHGAPPLPCVIDIEASGFGRSSYPIEVGYVLPDGRAACMLVRPAPEWTHWDDSAEQVHGITRATLQSHGRTPSDVAAVLNRDLAGMTVYCDGWAHDYPWLAALFEEAGTSPAFKLEAASRLLDDTRLPLLDAQQKRSREELGLSRHRASNDARALQSALVRLLN